MTRATRASAIVLMSQITQTLKIFIRSRYLVKITEGPHQQSGQEAFKEIYIMGCEICSWNWLYGFTMNARSGNPSHQSIATANPPSF